MAKPDRNGSRPFGAYERMLALRYLGAKRAQGGVGSIAVISVLGITAAVFVLIVTMSIMGGFQKTVLERIIGIGGHVWIDTRGFAADQVEQLRALALETPGAVKATPQVRSEALVSAGAGYAGAYVQGLSRAALEQIPEIAGNLRAGSLAGYRLGPEGEAEVAIGTVLAQKLGVGAGDELTLISPQGTATAFGSALRRKVYRVGAVFDAGYYEVNSLFIYLPIEEARLLFSRGEGADLVELRIEDPTRSDRFMRELRQAIGPVPIVSDWKAQNQSYVTALTVERTMLRIILMLVIAIAALNIITGLIMLVKNKARDVAILRTMGASQGAVLRVFLIVGGLLGASGTLVGVAAAVLFVLFIGPIQGFVEWATNTQVFDPSVYSLSRIPADINPIEIAGVSIFAIAMSFLASFWPARRAARLDPVEALRYE